MQIPVTIIGMAFDGQSASAAGKPVTIVGELHITGLSVGGGPMPPLEIWPSPGHPAHPIAPGGPPPSIWPSPGRPTHPIFYPPGIWGGANEPFPGYGLPKPPDPYPEPPPEGAKPPPPDGGWGYHPEYGWGYFPPAEGAKPKQPAKK